MLFTHLLTKARNMVLQGLSHLLLNFPQRGSAIKKLLLVISTIFLTSCTVGPYVTQKKLETYKILQESKVCIREGNCFSIAILRGPNGHDYLMVDYKNEPAMIKDRGWGLCDLTNLRTELEKSGKAWGRATDENRVATGLIGDSYVISFDIKHGWGPLGPFNDYEVEIEELWGEKSITKEKIHLLSNITLEPIIGSELKYMLMYMEGVSSSALNSTFGIQWDKGRLRVYGQVFDPIEGFKQVVGEWIDLRPYLLNLEKVRR